MRLSGICDLSAVSKAYTLPNQAPYQLGYTRIFRALPLSDGRPFSIADPCGNVHTKRRLFAGLSPAPLSPPGRGALILDVGGHPPEMEQRRDANLLQALSWAALGTAFPFLMTTLGAAAVFFFAREPRAGSQRALIGFAAGVMTAASIWSLLLPAIEQSAPLPGWLPASVGLLTGTVFLGLLDAALPRLRRGKSHVRHGKPGAEETGAAYLKESDAAQPHGPEAPGRLKADRAPVPEAQRRRDALLMTAITLHNIPEGMAVGLAFALAAAAGGEGLVAASALALGIGIQNFPEGAAVALPLRQEGRSRTRAFLGGVLSGAVEPLFGVLTALCAAGVRALLPWLLSFAAGAMLYVVVEELVPQAHSRAGTVGFVSGFLVMMVLDVALG